MNRVTIVVVSLAAVAAAVTGDGGVLEQADRRVPSVWPIVELRQYTMQPGKRDVLIDLFDAEFVETQEAVGMKVVGQFRDLDRPDRYVWLRAFRDMPSRAAALNTFYGGPVWAAHKALANSTMIDSDDVLLLRASEPRPTLPAMAPRPARGVTSAPNTVIAATIYSFADVVSPGFVTFFERNVQPVLTRAGLPVLTTLVTEESPNNFPALPVRGERVFVWLTQTSSAEEHQQFLRRLETLPEWTPVAADLRARLRQPAEVLRLQPTARSELR